MPMLSNLVLFHSGQVRNLYFLVLCQVKMNLQFCFIFGYYYELTNYIENRVDPDQLASEEAS